MGELFELTLSGGPAERLYRKLRPEIMRLPWGKPLGVRVSADERALARNHWTIAALQEYRSAHAQASVLELLVAARVPLDLSALASRFPTDELAHAEICARVANELGGGAPVAFDRAQVFPRLGPSRETPLLDATVHVARLFPVGEGWSFAYLDMLRRQARVPLLGAVWRTLVRDEAVHARFAWTFLDWAQGELGDEDWRSVERAVREDVASMTRGWKALGDYPKAAFSPISPLGPGDYEAYRERAVRALRVRVVAPFAKLGIDCQA